jgi:hypothetical protein
MLSKELLDQATNGLYPEIKSSYKVRKDTTASGDLTYSAGYSNEGFWLRYEPRENLVQLFFPHRPAASYKLPHSWLKKPLILYVSGPRFQPEERYG